MTNTDFEVVQGASFDTNIFLTDDAGMVINLSGYDVRGSIKQFYSDSNILANFNANIVSVPSGLITLNLSPSVTSGLSPSIAIYEVEIFTSGDAINLSLLRGRVHIYPNVI